MEPRGQEIETRGQDVAARPAETGEGLVRGIAALASASELDARARDPAATPPLYELIELMFFAYRDFVGDADRLLAGDRFGRAHHRVLYFVARRPGLTIAELLEILRITKQSLNRVLNDLVDRAYVVARSAAPDRRRRLLFSTARGDALIAAIAAAQSARFERVFATLGETARPGAMAFLAAMIDRSDPPLDIVAPLSRPHVERTGEPDGPR